MTTRRSRIKGIANIPQRRKPENEKIEEKKDQLGVEAKLESKCEVNDSNLTIINDDTTKSLSEDKGLPNRSEEHTDSNEISIGVSDHVETVEKKPITEEVPSVKVPPTSSKPPITFKRKLLKGSVSLSAIHKKKKAEEVRSVAEKRQEIDTEENLSKSNENYVKTETPKLSTTENQKKSDDTTPRYTISTSESIATTGTKKTENVFQKPASVINNTSLSDTEYPLPPPSPNKANRTRIKPIPRLAHRKTSFSASESEDESRKINRNRNDSVCSTTSAITESITECFSPQRPKEVITISQPKKSTVRSDQTRKIAEARREFVRRFGFNKPERNRLTMMDLIFYNPDTNPMVNEDNTKENNTEIEVDNTINEEENVDDPSNKNDTKSDEENEMPVPQIKIGPSGEIILDEQSLVIERKEVQRKREEMEKSKVLDVDKIKTGYGIYKKHKRTKFWTASETVYFYKALNTIGTDFTLMCELFPNRTRRELKIKFKKEEKVNRNLIDKALTQPCDFDFEDLKNEIELEERELEAIKKHQEELKKLKEEVAKENQKLLTEKNQKRKAAELNNPKTYVPKPKPISEIDIPKLVETKAKEKVPLKQKTKKEKPNKDNSSRPKLPKRSKKQKLSIKTYMSDSDADESDMATQSESEEDVVLSNKPTRSGRVPKATQRYDNEFSSIASLMKQNKIPDKDRPENIEPGSIMVITEIGPNGEPVYKLYMVTPEQKATPLDVPSDVAEAIQLKKGMSAKNIMTISANVTDDEEIIAENNITISADENITTMRNIDKNMETNITIPADENVTTLRSELINKIKQNVDNNDEQNVETEKKESSIDSTLVLPEGTIEEENFNGDIGRSEDNTVENNLETDDRDEIEDTSEELVKVISIEPLTDHRNLKKDKNSLNAQVIATKSDAVTLNHDFIYVNQEEGSISMNSEIVLEVDNDGISMKLEGELSNSRTEVLDSS
ncbi:uncharacterized protein LOC130441479 [Diorhabda sublineata]|uniref:uncharacterized protein LOC130441479 n=1 Tax=Diorhabda sublineata TaxID=1163346 RepID=UPI0024E18A87|nr:uncharacterized protein LOC130441479 [Diorhabda sublineata]